MSAITPIEGYNHIREYLNEGSGLIRPRTRAALLRESPGLIVRAQNKLAAFLQ